MAKHGLIIDTQVPQAETYHSVNAAYATSQGWDLSVCGLTLFPLSTSLSQDVY